MQIRVGRSSCYFPGNPAFCGDVDSAREIKKRELSLDICQEYLTVLVNSFKSPFYAYAAGGMVLFSVKRALVFGFSSSKQCFFLKRLIPYYAALAHVNHSSLGNLQFCSQNTLIAQYREPLKKRFTSVKPPNKG